MPSLTASERRSLALATALVVLGAGARLGFGPGPASWAWESEGGSPAADGLDSLRAAVDRSRDRARRAALPLAPGERIDPNRAPTEELERLPGVGPATARRIVAAREQRPFRVRGEMTRVPGIGPATLAKIRPHLALPDGAVRDAPAASVTGGPSSGRSPGRGARAAPLIDVNRADVATLERLPEVGPAIARRIVRSRRRDGPFRTVEDLRRVPGIGPVRLEAIRSRATVSKPLP